MPAADWRLRSLAYFSDVVQMPTEWPYVMSLATCKTIISAPTITAPTT